MANPSVSPFATRSESAVRLAVLGGQRLGIRVDEPRVLHDVFNVLVHLAPSPVVVRVPSLSLRNAEEQAAQQRNELAVTGWLADTAEAAGETPLVVRPSPLVPREPLLVEDRSLTFWEYVEEKAAWRDAGEDEAQLTARLDEQCGWTPRLHAALADCPVELPTLSPVVPATGLALSELRKNAQLIPGADLDRAEEEYAVLESVFPDLESRFPGARSQVLHGDAPAYNVLRTGRGHLFGDFEDTTRGPVEWDLALVGPEGVAAYEDAGGVRLDRDLLRLMGRARQLQVVGAMALVPQMPQMGPTLEPMIAQWRESEPLTSGNLAG